MVMEAHESPLQPVLRNNRLVATETLVHKVMDPEERALEFGDYDRKNAFDFLTRIISGALIPQGGIPLIQVQKRIIVGLAHFTFHTEQSPPVLCAFVGFLSAMIQSFGEAVSCSRQMLDKALQSAVKAEKNNGILSDVPLGIQRIARGLEAGDGRVFVTKKEAVDAAKMLVALSYRLPPEVRERTRRGIERAKETVLGMDSSVVDEVNRILVLPQSFTRESFADDNFFRLKKNTPKISRGVVEITAANLAEADGQACWVALVNPDLISINIYIESTGESIQVSGEEYYKWRLMERDSQYLVKKLVEQNSSTARMHLVKV